MNMYYVRFSEPPNKGAMLVWAIIAETKELALSKAETIGKNPMIERGPYPLSADWHVWRLLLQDNQELGNLS